MLQCFLCYAYFDENKLLLMHLRLFHHMGNNAFYKCSGFKDCSRNFSTLPSFRKHLKYHVQVEQNLKVRTPYNTKVCNEKPDEIPVSEEACSSNKTSDNNVPETFDETPYIDSLPQKFISENVNFKTILENPVSLLICKLYDSNMPRSVIQRTIDNYNACFVQPLQLLKHVVAKNLQTSADPEKCSEINDMFIEMEKMFDNVDTEYYRFKYLESTGKFIKPISVSIGCRFNLNKKNIIENRYLTVQFIPLRYVLTHFLQLDGVFDSIIRYAAELNQSHDVLSNIVQGTL